MTARQSSEIAGIDYLRLCAASLVMAFHFLYANRLASGQSFFSALSSTDGSNTFFNYGWVGVELFFVISGYVIAFSARERTPWSFLKGRFVRLVPGVWFCASAELIVLAVLSDVSHADVFGQWLRTMVFWPRGQIDSVYWTLQIEVCFYLIILLMMQAGLRRFIEHLLVFLGLCSGVFWFIEMNSQGATHDILVNRGDGTILRSLLLTHGCFFAVGVSLFSGFRDRFTVPRIAALLALVVCCTTEIIAHARWMSDVSHLYVSSWPPVVTFIVGVAAVVVSIRYNGRISQHLGERGLRWTRMAGRMTYPLYLIHQTVGDVVVSSTARWIGISSVPLAMALAFVAAFLIERYPERWIRHALTGREKAREIRYRTSPERSAAQNLPRRAGSS